VDQWIVARGRTWDCQFVACVGELARLTFRGEKLVFAYDKSPGRSLGVVTIDGVDKGSIDFYASTDQEQYSTVFTGLGAGIHIINITNAAGGQYIDVDYVTDMVQGYAQIFGQYQNISPGFNGSSAYITTQDPPLYKPGKLVTHTSITNFSNPGSHFIEAGAIKDCDPPLTTCELHPICHIQIPLTDIRSFRKIIIEL